jgi:hypothetical protein
MSISKIKNMYIFSEKKNYTYFLREAFQKKKKEKKKSVGGRL